MLTKKQSTKRDTRLMRVQSQYHSKIRKLSFEQNTTASKILDEVIAFYFDEKMHRK